MTYCSDHHLLLSRGRKAGLTASELSSALSACPVQGKERLLGQADGNGFVSGTDSGGHRTQQPAAQQPGK